MVDANKYYRAIDDADSYFNDRLHSTDWTGATDADKEKALLAAARSIDALRFKGLKVSVFDITYDSNGKAISPVPTQSALETADAAQALEWPRDGLDFAPDTPSTVQTLLQYATNPSAGNITVTITLADGTSFTTADIAYDAVASTIETAIDAAATGSVTGWTNGDIAVSGGPLTTGNVTLTFSGDSVKDKAHSARPVVATSTGWTGGTLATVTGSATVTGQCPDDVFFAQCEEAISLLSGKNPEVEFCNLTLTSDGVSSTRATIDRSGMPPKHTSHMFTSSLAWRHLQGLLVPENGSFQLKRA